jgi:CBS domain-containing protein
MRARDIMTATPTAVTPDDTIARAAACMRDLSIGCVPVVNDQLHRRLVGLITDRDIAVRCVAENASHSSTVGNHMSHLPLQTVLPEAPVSDVMRLMERAQVRRIPVVSNDGELLGIIAQADLANKVGPIQPLSVEEVL